MHEEIKLFLKQKQGTVAPRTLMTYEGVLKTFQMWLSDSNVTSVMAEDITGYARRLLKTTKRLKQSDR
jgi:hypothetical protein